MTSALTRGTRALIGACVVAIILLIALLFLVIVSDNVALRNENAIQNEQLQDLVLQNRGPRGDDGLSAYEIWLSLGNEGSEQDFIESLRGKPGTNGIDGRDGSDGKDGTPGAGVKAPVCVAGTQHYWYSTNGKFLGSTSAICLQ